MANPPTRDFGKRKPVTVTQASPPVKRSRHVALLLTGTLAVGGSAYALMPRENCQPSGPAVAAPAPPISGATTQPSPAPVTNCGSRYSSGGHGGSGGSWSRSSFYGGSTTSSGGSTGAGSTTTTRGGFGSFGHLFSGGG